MITRFDVGHDKVIIQRAHALRRAVFIVEQKIDPADEWDDLDDKTVHFVVVNEETKQDIATARIMYCGDVAKLQRIAVLKDMRGFNIGYDLIRFMLDHARAQSGIRSAKLGAQCYAIPFYEKLGFGVTGDVYDDAGIPHRDMKRSL